MKLTKLQLVEIIKEELNKTFPKASVQGGPLQTEAGFWEGEDLSTDLGENPYEAFLRNKTAAEKQAPPVPVGKRAERVWSPAGAPKGLDAKAVQDLYNLSEDEYEQLKRSAYATRWDLPAEKFWPMLFGEEAIIDPAVERLISAATRAPGAGPSAASWGTAAAGPALLNPATMAFGTWAIGDWLKDWYKDARLKGRLKPIYADRIKAQREAGERREEKKLGVSPDISWKHARSPAYSPGHGHGWGWGSLEENKSLEELDEAYSEKK